MSWLFSQALVAEYSAANSSDGAPSAPSNTTPTPQAFLWLDKTTDAWSRFPSGLTCEPLTGSRGEELLTWFREGFLAPTSAPLARAQELKASSQDCGARWRALSAKFDRASSSWKTAHCLLSEDLPWSSVTLPKWGMMRAGELWERTMLALRTNGTESGLWLPTPISEDRFHRANPAQLNRNSLKLSVMAAHGVWPDNETYPTPTRTWGTGGHGGSGAAKKMKALNINVRKLSPVFVEWLMAWPLAWTDLKPLATDKFQQWQHLHGVCSEGQQHED